MQHLVYFLLILATAAASARGQSSNMCSSGEIRCPDNQCIPYSSICDNTTDCSNGTDELICSSGRGSSGCGLDEYTCSSNNTCIPLALTCDGVLDCSDGEDEIGCEQAPGSLCLVHQFQCPPSEGLKQSNLSCVSMAEVCNGDYTCSEGADEIDCSPPTVISPPEPLILASTGSGVILSCQVAGNPMPFVTWLKDLKPLGDNALKYILRSEAGHGLLYIENVTVFDAGLYYCKADSINHSYIINEPTNVTVIDNSTYRCEGQYKEGQYYYSIDTRAKNVSLLPTTDVIFVVDESGSMAEAQQWVRDIVPVLDHALTRAGLGTRERLNKYSLVGFKEVAVRVLSQPTSPEGFVNASRDLTLDGVLEDGYAGIDAALNEVELRNNTLRTIILVTDEDRTALLGNEHLTRDSIEQRLRERGITLNTVVRQGFLYDETDNSSFAFGLLWDQQAYSYDPLSSNLFVLYPSGVRHPDPLYNEGNTYHDYVQLSWSTRGASWFIDIVEYQGDILTAFSNAFIDGQIANALSQKCLRCLCLEPTSNCIMDTNITLDECQGEIPQEASVSVRVSASHVTALPGTTVTLTCIVLANIPYDIQWRAWSGVGPRDVCTTGATCRDNTAIIGNFTSHDGGAYTCTVATSVGNISDSIVITPLVAPIAVITEMPADGLVTQGTSLSLTCSASGMPRPLIYWTKLDVPGVQPAQELITVRESDGNSTLIILPVEMRHSGTYQCIAISRAGSSMDSTTIDVLYSDCMLQDGSMLNPGESRRMFGLGTDPLAANIVLLVDESGSMMMLGGRAWLSNMTKELDRALRDIHIGSQQQPRNQFGVLGFGFYQVGTGGRLLQHNGASLVGADNVERLSLQLAEAGKYEDGYFAIDLAARVYNFTGGAGHLIMLTDEERDILNVSMSRDSIVSVLEQNDLALSTVVAGMFHSNTGLPALGINKNDTAYVYDPTSSTKYRKTSRLDTPDIFFYQSTKQDYVQLALAQGGSSWNINLLQNTADQEAFTAAFVNATADNIYDQLKECFNCTCFANRGMLCRPDTDTPPCTDPSNISEQDNSVQARVQVFVEPTHVVLEEGVGVAQLACHTDVGGANMVWTHNGGDIPSVAMVTKTTNTTTLTISNVNKTQAGTYSCLVSTLYAQGDNSSIIDVLSRSNPLQLTVDPHNANVYSGQNVSFSCVSGIQDNITNYTWQFNYNDLLPSNAVISRGASGSVLSISHVSLFNRGRYTCSGKSPVLAAGVDAILEVIVGTLQNVVLSESGPLNVTEGDIASKDILCNISCLCDENSIILRWYYNNIDRLPNGVEQVAIDNLATRLHIATVIGTEHDGLYTCRGEYHNQTIEQGIQLLVAGGLKVTLTESIFAEQEIFTCYANYDVVEWVWSFDGAIVNATDDDDIMIFDDIASRRSVLLVKNVTQYNEGQYNCTALGTDTERSAAISLPSVSLTLTPPGPMHWYNYTIGDSINITCEVMCQCDAVTTTWNSDGEQLFMAGLESVQHEQQRISLVALNATVDMSGIYSCTAYTNNNELLSHTQNIRIEIQ